MERFRVCVTNAQGQVQLLDFTFSQVCEMLREAGKETKDTFWENQFVTLPDGQRIKLLGNV